MNDAEKDEARLGYQVFFTGEIGFRLPDHEGETRTPGERLEYSSAMCFKSDSPLGGPTLGYPCRRAFQHVGPCDCFYGTPLGATGDPSLNDTEVNAPQILMSIQEILSSVHARTEAVPELLASAKRVKDVYAWMRNCYNEALHQEGFALFGVYVKEPVKKEDEAMPVPQRGPDPQDPPKRDRPPDDDDDDRGRGRRRQYPPTDWSSTDVRTRDWNSGWTGSWNNQWGNDASRWRRPRRHAMSGASLGTDDQEPMSGATLDCKRAELSAGCSADCSQHMSSGRPRNSREETVDEMSPPLKRRRSSRCGGPLMRSGSTSGAAQLAMLSLLPTVAAAMELALPGTQTMILSGLGLMCSAAWYTLGLTSAVSIVVSSTSAMLSVISMVLGLLEVIASGAENVVIEIVYGSTLVIRIATFGLFVIVAIVIFRTGHWFARWNNPQMIKSKHDLFLERYGGRLKGGGKAGPGLTAREVFANDLPARKPEPAEVERVDPDKLDVGDFFSFLYDHGSRPNQRRMVWLKEKQTFHDSILLVCIERKKLESGLTEIVIRNYWPIHTSNPIYDERDEDDDYLPVVVPQDNTSNGRGELSAGRSADCSHAISASPGSSSSKDGNPPVSSTPTCATFSTRVVGRARAALGYTDDCWKASPQWKRERRSLSADGAVSASLALASHGPIGFFTGKGIEPAYRAAFQEVKRTIDGFAYQMDHTGCVIDLTSFLARGGQVRFLYDKSNFLYSSCERQAPRVLDLYNHGCAMKVVPKPGFACMHCKTMIFDQAKVYTGSVNLTHNGFENNKEHLIVLADSAVAARFMQDFEDEWAKAETVTQEVIDDMMRRYNERVDKKRSEPQRSRSKSLNRGTSRSLSTEFQEVSQ